MIKRKGLLYTLKYYNIILFLIIGLMLFIAKSYISTFVASLLDIYPGDKFYTLTSAILQIGIIVIWLILFLLNIRNRIYQFRTGRSFPKDRTKYKRSYYELLEYFENAEPHKLDLLDFKEEKWTETKGIIFGIYKKQLISISSYSECNIACFGPPGSGKTSGIAIINAMSFEGSVLAVDIKGDLYYYVSRNSNRKILRFCPDAPNAEHISCRFDPLANIDSMSETDKKLYIESMATVLIKEEGENGDNYFTSRARKIFQGVTYLLLDKNPNIGFPDIIHEILKGNIFDFVNVAINSNCIPAKEYLASFYGNSEKNVSGAYDALTTALVTFSNPILDKLLARNSSDNKDTQILTPIISIDMLEQGYDIYLQISQEHLAAYAPLFTLIIQSFSTAFTKRPDTSTGAQNRPILMLLDEFPQLTFSQELINTNLSTLRSKSIIIMLIQQNLSQLEVKYKPAGARSILGNCSYQIILGSNDINSSKVFSDTFGYKRVLKLSNSETKSQNNSSSWSVQESSEKVYPPEYFGDLSYNNAMIIYFKGRYAELTKLNCYLN